MENENNDNEIVDIENLGKEIEDIVWELDVSYIDATVLYAERHGIEYDLIGQAVQLNDNLKGRIQEEAEKLRFLPKISRLPIDE